MEKLGHTNGDTQMAIIVRNKSTVYGLNTDLSTLYAADVTEIAARSAADGDLTALTTAAKTNLVAAINELRGSLVAEVADRGTAITTEIAARNTAIATEEAARIAGDLALGVRIDNVLSNVDGVALNSLTEIVTAFQAADGTLNGAITALASSASTAVTTEATTARAAELVLRNNLIDEASAARAAELLLSNNLIAEATARNAQAAVPVLESLVVTSGKIVLSAKPQGGMVGIMNFATVRFIDNGGVAFDATVAVDTADTTGKTYTVLTDGANWDTLTVSIQYLKAAV
jgi:hypothetical protein